MDIEAAGSNPSKNRFIKFQFLEIVLLDEIIKAYALYHRLMKSTLVQGENAGLWVWRLLV